MKVCGFTFIRNAIKYDYPIVESIQSILPICDAYVVAVGQSDDETRELIVGLSDKIILLDTIWDDQMRKGGKVLAEETNKAFQAIPLEYDWCIYLQGDEVIHEKYLDTLKLEMFKEHHNDSIQGLLLKYLHFYGSYQYIANAAQWYRKEIRIIKNLKSIYSYKDAQGFRIDQDKKLRVKEIDAFVYHYGWVKNPIHMQNKQSFFQRLWHSDQVVAEIIKGNENFDYSAIESLVSFEESHPQVMKDRVEHQNWDFEYDISRNRLSFKEKFRLFTEKYFDWIPGEYQNYQKVK